MAQNFPPSARASATLEQGPAWTLMERVKSLPKYDAHNKPDGLINLSGALNGLMEDWMKAYADKSLRFTSEALSYGSLSGSQDLLSTAAAFFNRFFDPAEPVAAEQVLAANGVTSLLNMMAWTLCDEGDGVIYTTPGFYMLDFDLSVRTGLITVPVSTTDLKDPFGTDGLDEFIQALEAATDNARDKLNVKCRMLCLTNPSNPQGRWYSKETLEALASWCARRQMHLVIDEIYALSTFAKENGQGNPNGGGLVPMTSILSVSARENVHCLYGLSKDFNMGGVRMAFLVSRNTQVRAAVSKITWFTWLSVMSDKFVTGFLEQLDLVQQYLDVYRPRLSHAYHQVATALETHKIPFQRAEAGLFVFIDLSAWIHHFQDLDGKPPATDDTLSPELQLCEWLIDHGVFLNAGQFAGCDVPGHFRLVFTQDLDATLLGIRRIRSALDQLDHACGS
ncbi:Aminotran-1-2 domain-containing protein [Fusarium sp. LHS14.1]|nr:Aminotran-1-2 domain-containing protein [Fusarium sp. LHS14.1]